MKYTALIFGLLLIPSVSFAAPLTTDQATSLIAVVQSSTTTPASAFVPLITAFSLITDTQATRLIEVVQAAPGVPSQSFINLLIAFTVDPTPTIAQTPTLGSTQTTTQPVIPTPTTTQTAPVVQSVVMPNWTIKIITEDGAGKRDVPATAKAGTGQLKLWVEVYDKDNKQVKQAVTVTTNDPDLPSSFVINAPNHTDFFCIAPNPTGQNGCPVENPVSVGTFDFTFTVEDVSVTKQVIITE